MSKVVMNHIIELILSLYPRLGSCFVGLAGDFEVVLHYTILR